MLSEFSTEMYSTNTNALVGPNKRIGLVNFSESAVKDSYGKYVPMQQIFLTLSPPIPSSVTHHFYPNVTMLIRVFTVALPPVCQSVCNVHAPYSRG